MVKSLPNHPKVSGQLEIPLVSEFVPQSRQGGRDCGGMAWPSVLGSGFFFFLPRSSCSEDTSGMWVEGHIDKCFVNILLGGK